VHGTAAEIARQIKEGELFEPGEHNLLVYDELTTLRQVFAESAKTFLSKNEILLIASQYETIDTIGQALENVGIDVSKHLADGTLFIIDAQKGYQGADTRGTFKLAMSLIQRAKKEGRSGVTWFGDMGSFFAFQKIGDLVDYELCCPTKYEDPIKTICCYHNNDFKTLEKNEQDRLIEHHFKNIFMK
jgi:hypothetical protein